MRRFFGEIWMTLSCLFLAGFAMSCAAAAYAIIVDGDGFVSFIKGDLFMGATAYFILALVPLPIAVVGYTVFSLTLPENIKKNILVMPFIGCALALVNASAYSRFFSIETRDIAPFGAVGFLTGSIHWLRLKTKLNQETANA